MLTCRKAVATAKVWRKDRCSPDTPSFDGWGPAGWVTCIWPSIPRLPRRDALKILPSNLTEDLEFRQRFNREADLAASLYHEHIVGIHDRGEYQGQLWISMDYVEGTDAAKLLRSQYPSGMPKADVVEIISAVADALDHAHSRGLLHRDVKPANILLGSSSPASPRRRILLADFGIAREMGEISGLTATNMLVGTTAYCAPEQLQGDDLDARADQYALGCTAFNLLTGVAPFQHSNPAVVISQHLSAPPPLVSERRPELAELDAVIAKAMAKDPNERYATCADFASALAGQGLTAPAAVAGPTEVIAATDRSVATPRLCEGARQAGAGRRWWSRRWSPSRWSRWPRWSVCACWAREAHHKNSSAPSASVAPPTVSVGAAVSAGAQADQPDHRSVGRAGPRRARRGGQGPHQALRRARHPPVGGVRQKFRRPQAVQMGRGHHARQRFRRHRRHPGRGHRPTRPTPSGCPTR